MLSRTINLVSANTMRSIILSFRKVPDQTLSKEARKDTNEISTKKSQMTKLAYLE